MYSHNPYTLNNNKIFDDLKKAQSEIIIHFLTEPETDSIKNLKVLQRAGVESFSVSSLNFNFKDTGGEELPLPEKAYVLLKNYLLYNADIIRIERG
jgi:hypothetical protein